MNVGDYFILFYATFVLQIIFNVLIENLYEDLEKGMWSLSHANSSRLEY